MANNKVQLSDGTVLLDLTGDTVTPETLMAGVTAHNAAGNPIVGTSGGGGTCTVTLTCEASDSRIAYLSPDGVWHMDDLLAGANVFQVAQNSPIFVYNLHSINLTNLVNIVRPGKMIFMGMSYQTGMFYELYYATASTASATQPTDTSGPID